MRIYLVERHNGNLLFFKFRKYLRRKQSLSMDLSLRVDRILVMKSPAAEKALSASTEVGGTVKIAL